MSLLYGWDGFVVGGNRNAECGLFVEAELGRSYVIRSLGKGLLPLGRPHRGCQLVTGRAWQRQGSRWVTNLIKTE